MKSILTALLICVVASPVVWAHGEEGDPSTISVTGEAVVKVVPDKVTIHFGIETWDQDIQLAKKQNNDILAAAMSAIKKAGVKDGNVRTDHLSIEPRYKYGFTREDFIGYFVRNSISVVVNDPEKVEGLLTSVIAAGVTHIHGVTFETTEFKKHREEARRLALEAAREKAEKMAAVLGLRVGRALGISEGRDYGAFYGSGWGWGWGRGGQGMSQNVMQNQAEPSDVSDTFALGKISIRGSVSVRFATE